MCIQKFETKDTPIVDETRNYVFVILESLGANQRACITHNKAILDYLLPTLLSKI
jgi:hypothetical protein